MDELPDVPGTQGSLRRVVFYTPGWPPGNPPNGIVTYVDNLRRGLRTQGVESHVIPYEVAPGPLGADITPLPSDRSAFLGRRIFESALRRLAGPRPISVQLGRRVGRVLGSLHRRWPFDLFEVEESFGFSAVASRFIPAPTLVRLHGPWFLNGKALGIAEDQTFRNRVAQEGRAIQLALAVSSPSQDVLRQTCAHYGFEPAHSAVIPNPGPDLPRERSWTLSGADRNAILFVGRFDRHKGGDVMIDAFQRVARILPEARLFFAGPDRGLRDDSGRAWTLPDFLNDRFPDAATRSRVRVLGMQTPEAIADLRRQCLVSVVPSRYENLPMTVIEAMAYGCPLVATNSGGIAELVRDGVNARLFPSADAESLAAVLVETMKNPEASARLGESARRDYEQRLAPGPVVERMMGFYQEVLARARSAGAPARP